MNGLLGRLAAIDEHAHPPSTQSCHDGPYLTLSKHAGELTYAPLRHFAYPRHQQAHLIAT
jgi:hypothetical protein